MGMAMLCKNMTFLGLVASLDPPRAGVGDSVRAAHQGNINVVMITGDYLKTAAAIARDIGILDSGKDGVAAGEALDCSVLRPSGAYVAEGEIDKLTKQARVFARAQPEDKLQIVHSLQRQGLVCAMTGDGVNDAPALKASDIGVAMGIQGTDVAKGASDVILTDDNFCSIVGAMPVMRTPLQILFLILVTDLAPSIALGLEPGQRGIMKEHPRPKKQPILLPWMWFITIVNSIILAGVIMAVYTWGLDHYVDELDVDEIGEDIQEEGHNSFTAKQLAKARTVAFIAL